jgi:hypothetical protein
MACFRCKENYLLCLQKKFCYSLSYKYLITVVRHPESVIRQVFFDLNYSINHLCAVISLFKLIRHLKHTILHSLKLVTTIVTYIYFFTP